MKLRSVQFKYLTIVISAILSITIFVGGFSIYKVDKYIKQNTEEFIYITCSNEAAKINNIFGDLEKSVKIMESYVLSLFDNTSDITNRDKQNEIIDMAGEMFVDVAKNTDGAVAYYLRLSPEISDWTTGMFYTKLASNNEFTYIEPTDLSIYDKSDNERVGWYWQPYEAGHPIWLEPYHNKNNDIIMISYVIPLYYEDQFLGVVGIDFDYTVLTDRILEIKIYENGFAHLELNNTIIHNGKENQDLLNSSENKYLQVSEKLDNGMMLVLSADYNDIKQIRYEIAYSIICSMLLLTFIFTLVVISMVKKVVKPLKSLSDAAIKLSNEDYDVEIKHSDTYEIKQLSTAFENMLVSLREHKKLQNFLTYTDPLTGLRNTTAYKDWIIDFDKKIKDPENPPFGVVVLDINFLKMANDTYGHNIGNQLIVKASQIISSTFDRSPVFRIGGDEFSVILQGKDLQERDVLFAKFKSECEKSFIETEDGKIPISIAQGFSIFDSTNDTEFTDVFNRADDEMYKNKKNMKEMLA